METGQDHRHSGRSWQQDPRNSYGKDFNFFDRRHIGLSVAKLAVSV